MDIIFDYLGSYGTALLAFTIATGFAASLPSLIEMVDRWKKARHGQNRA